MTVAATAPGTLMRWRIAARPPTLTAAVAPVLVGCGVAISQWAFSLLPALAALFGAIALQVGANFANDVFDFQRGADTAHRLGPPRVTQTGLMSAAEVKRGMWVAFGVAFVIGIYLVYVGGWPIVAVGLSSIAAAIIYTGGPWPIGYHALGDLFTFVFFGVVAVTGTYYVQAGDLDSAAVWASIPMGCTVTAILVVNNLRDIPTDRVAGKTTLGVVMGDRATRAWYVSLLVGAYAGALALWPLGYASPAVLLVVLSVVPALPLLKAVTSGVEGRPLNLTLRGTARFDLIFGALFAVGLALS